jgi:prefoldin subunit 5
MEKLDYLLTEEFVEFSQKIAKIFEAKKAKKLELKTFYEKIQNELKTLEDEAKQAEQDFEAFKQKATSKED